MAERRSALDRLQERARRSGVVEAACKTLVAQRLELSGMRWGTHGAQAILTMRGWDLVDYAAEPDDPAREVPNPRWADVDAKLHAARQRVEDITRRIGVDATLRALGLTQRRRAVLPRAVRQELGVALAEVAKLVRRRERTPRRIPVGARNAGPVIELAVERKHLTNVLKMVAYQAESDLVRTIVPHYKRADDEGRTLVPPALASAADIRVDKNELVVTLAPLSSAHRSRAVEALCQEMNAAAVSFPGTRLRLRYAVATPP